MMNFSSLFFVLFEISEIHVFKGMFQTLSLNFVCIRTPVVATKTFTGSTSEAGAGTEFSICREKARKVCRSSFWSCENARFALNYQYLLSTKDAPFFLSFFFSSYSHQNFHLLLPGNKHNQTETFNTLCRMVAVHGRILFWQPDLLW